MNKNNENDNTNKQQSFSEKLKVYQNQNQDSKMKSDAKKIEDENNIKESKTNKNISQVKKVDDNIIKNDKLEEKLKETKNVSNIIEQINKREELNKAKINENIKMDESDNKKEKAPMRNSNFLAARNVFASIQKEKKEKKDNIEKKENKENKEKIEKKEKKENKENKDIINEKDIKENKNIKEKLNVYENKENKDKKEENKENKDIKDNKNKNEKENIKENIDIKKNEKNEKNNNNEVKKEEPEKTNLKLYKNKSLSTNVNDKIKMFNQQKEGKNNENNNININEEKEKDASRDYIRKRGATIQERAKLWNTPKNEDTEIKTNYKANKNKKVEIDKNTNKDINNKENKVISTNEKKEFRDRINKIEEKMPKKEEKEKKEEKDGEKVKNVENLKKEEKEKKEEKIKKEEKEKKEEKKEENEKIGENKEKENQQKEEIKMNSVRNRAILFSSNQSKKPNQINNYNDKNNIKTMEIEIKNKNEEENNNPDSTSDSKTNINTHSNSVKQKILNIEKQKEEKNIKKEKEKEKPQINWKANSSILEKIKLFYQPDIPIQKTPQENNINITKSFSDNNNKNNEKKKSQESTENNYKENSKIENNNNNEILDNKIISNQKEKSSEQINDKMKDDGMKVTSMPKKLNLKEIFKNMNIDQVASNVETRKREELMKFAQKQKEEENKIINEPEIESDNENENENEIDNEEKEKEEDINEEEENLGSRYSDLERRDTIEGGGIDYEEIIRTTTHIEDNNAHFNSTKNTSIMKTDISSNNKNNNNNDNNANYEIKRNFTERQNFASILEKRIAGMNNNNFDHTNIKNQKNENKKENVNIENNADKIIVNESIENNNANAENNENIEYNNINNVENLENENVGNNINAENIENNIDNKIGDENIENNIENNKDNNIDDEIIEDNRDTENIYNNLDNNDNENIIIEDSKDDIDGNINIEKEKINISHNINKSINQSVNLTLKEGKSEYLTKSIGFKAINSYNDNNIKDFRNTMTFSNAHNNISLDKLDNTEIFLEQYTISQKDNLINDSFCESFFLTSFSKDNGKLMDNSEQIQSECNHFICSFLPAMQPEIIYKYPKEDIKGLEINNLAASICFPNGIKICYHDYEDEIKTVKNYRSSFTNQIGDRFFAVTYHFYLKMSNEDFEEQYNETPIKHQDNTNQDELYETFNDEMEEDRKEKKNLYDKLKKKKNVYIPFCLCLISKYPFIKQMEKCLESIMILINTIEDEEDTDILNQLIAYIVKAIPAPPKQSKVLFPLPLHNKFVEIQQPYFRDITQFGDNPIIILNFLSASHILSLFKLLIFEQKVLIVGKNNDYISQIILNFVSLLYPFEWIHTFIPIMSEKMVKFLQAFLPFFNGINSSLYGKAKDVLAKAGKGVFIFSIDDDKIEINSNLKSNNKKIKASAYIKKHFPSLPKYLENLILKELKLIKLNYDKYKKDYDKYNANLKLKNLFLHVFVELIQDYKKYSYIIDDYPVFNSFLMIKDKKNDKSFFKEFTSTQLFQMFIQNSLFKDKDKQTVFEERLKNYLYFKNKGFGSNYLYQKYENLFKKEYKAYFENKNNYIIKPYFIKDFDKFEETYTSKNKIMKLSQVSLYLSKQYEEQIFTNINAHGVLRENKRVIKKPIKLDNANDPEFFDVFLIPGQNIEDIINNDKIIKTKSSDGYKKTKSIKMGIIAGEKDDKENNIKMTQCITNKENELSEDEIDEIKDNIREIMTRIYRSDVSKIEDDKKTILNCMESQFGRDYFISILNTGNIIERDIKLVIEESYEFFHYVIFNSLLNILKLEENTHNYLCSVKLLKACLCIKSVKNKKEILLSDELFFKLDNYAFFKKKEFWYVWIEDELTKGDIQFLEKYKNAVYVEEGDEDYKLYLQHSYNVLGDLNSIMIKFKLKTTFIIGMIGQLIKEYIINEKDFQTLMQTVLSELNYFQKLSQSK